PASAAGPRRLDGTGWGGAGTTRPPAGGRQTGRRGAGNGVRRHWRTRSVTRGRTASRASKPVRPAVPRIRADEALSVARVRGGGVPPRSARNSGESDLQSLRLPIVLVAREAAAL